MEDTLKNWSKFAKIYDPTKCASIDGTDCEPHDRAVIRAINSEYRPNRFVKGRPECTIFVSRLNHNTTKETIKELFSKYGKLKRFRVVKDIVTGMPKGYAFVEYEEENGAEDAYRLANKNVVDGNTIFVDFECERLLKGWKPRRLGGGFGGKKESGQLRFGGRDRPFKKPIALELKEQGERRQKERERRNKEEERRRRDKSRDNHRHTLSITKDHTNSPGKTKKRERSKSKEKPNKRPSPKNSKTKSPSRENGTSQEDKLPSNIKKLNSDSPILDNKREPRNERKGSGEKSSRSDRKKSPKPIRKSKEHFNDNKTITKRRRSPLSSPRRRLQTPPRNNGRSPLNKRNSFNARSKSPSKPPRRRQSPLVDRGRAAPRPRSPPYRTPVDRRIPRSPERNRSRPEYSPKRERTRRSPDRKPSDVHVRASRENYDNHNQFDQLTMPPNSQQYYNSLQYVNSYDNSQELNHYHYPINDTVTAQYGIGGYATYESQRSTEGASNHQQGSLLHNFDREKDGYFDGNNQQYSHQKQGFKGNYLGTQSFHDVGHSYQSSRGKLEHTDKHYSSR
ncbi:U1 small nuclear ribonucleoprotein 70 kDa-like [Euwallacea similis]|uniref:U1 small nuclear ribonucleoprotein 70 kDa-like n=1 Tax=Euwallacea similis TaxID=1736056 RepID=UPI0034506F98